jgi:hypothetical protein
MMENFTESRKPKSRVGNLTIGSDRHMQAATAGDPSENRCAWSVQFGGNFIE